MQTQPMQNVQPGTTQQGEEMMSAGTRFEYSQAPYRDVIFAIVFVAMVIGMIIYVIVAFSGSEVDGDYGALIGLCFLLMFIGAGGGIVGLQVIKCIPETIIKLVLFTIIGLYALCALILFVAADGAAASGIFPLLIAVIFLIYAWIIWSRIPFAATLLWIAARICTKYSGVLWIALIALVMQLFYAILWVLFFIGLIVANDGSLDGISVFLILITLYWGFQVFKNVSHTTTCGVAATWFFYKDAPPNVTANALKRTMTTSFGSVCFGSLLIAIVQAMRAMARGRGRGGCLQLICMLLLCLCESLIKFITEYAFAYVAIYGQSFYTSSKMTFELLNRRGWWAVINSAVMGIAIFGGAMISGIVVALIGFLIGLAYDDGYTQWILLVIGFFVGYYMAYVMLQPVVSAVVALFVCYAEDPEALKQNHLDEYTRLTNSEPRLVVVMVTQVMVVQQPMGMQPMGMQPMGQPVIMQPMGQPMGQPMIVQQPMQTQMPPQ